jgi:hypothetical protein
LTGLLVNANLVTRVITRVTTVDMALLSRGGFEPIKFWVWEECVLDKIELTDGIIGQSCSQRDGFLVNYDESWTVTGLDVVNTVALIEIVNKVTR